jgi:homoserine acetyltransferase
MIERLKETNSRRFRWLSASPIMAFRMTRGAGMRSRSGLMAGASKSIMQQNRTVSSPSPPGLMARTRPWSVAMNEVARRILMADPGFPSGPYGAGFEAWAALTRVITNREPGALEGAVSCAVPDLVEQAIAAAGRVSADPLDWIYQSWAYDAHDVGTTSAFGGDTAAALRTVKAPTLLLIPRLDLYNPVDDAIEAVTLVPNATLVHLDGRAGHAVAAETSPQLATSGSRSTNS